MSSTCDAEKAVQIQPPEVGAFCVCLWVLLQSILMGKRRRGFPQSNATFVVI